MAKKEASKTVRDEFSKLSLDGKTSFLVEAVFSTAGSAINEIGERVTSLVDLVAGGLSDEDAQSDAEPVPKEESSGSKEKKNADEASK